VTRFALRAILSHWSLHPFQLAVLLIGLSLATGLWTSVQVLNAEARASYQRAENQINMAQWDILTSQTDLTLEDFAELRRRGILVSPVLEHELQGGSKPIKLLGIDPLSFPGLEVILGTDHAPSTDPLPFLLPPGQVVLHPETLGDLNLTQELPPYILNASIPPGVVFSDISFVARFSQQENRISYFIMPSYQPLTQNISTKPPSRFKLQKAEKSALGLSRLTESFHLNLTTFGFLSFAVGLFIVQGIVSLTFEQRRRLIRTLRCLGLPLSKLVLFFLAEILTLALISGTAGLLIGYFTALLLLPNVSATLSDLFDTEALTYLHLRREWVLSGLSMACIGALASSAYAFWQLWRMPILLGPSFLARGQQSVKGYGLLLVAGGFCCLGGVLVFQVIGGLMGGFALLTGVMLGTALSLPYLIAKILRCGSLLAQKPIFKWIWADTAAQLPGMSLALMALLLAMATNIGVGTMVSSFRLTFLGWMDQRLSAELYVTARDDAEGDALEDWLHQQRITTLPIRSTEFRFEGQLLKIYGVVDHTTYRSNWPMLSAEDGVWDKLARSEGILINEQLARRMAVGLGDQLLLPETWPKQILGIYSDYGNPDAQAIVSMPSLLALAPGAENRRFGLRLAQQEVPSVMKKIQQAFDLPNRNVVDQASLKARSLHVFDQTFLVTGALSILTLGIAAFAMLTSFLTIWNQRLPQLAPVWAMGIERRQLAFYDILRSLLYAALTTLLALPLGLVLAWVLLHVVNAEAFGWQLPMHLFPLDWLGLGFFALLAALVAAALPAWRLSRIEPSTLLKVFANDR